MSFIQHLEELRWHLFRSVVAVVVVSIAVFSAKRLVFDSLIFGPIKPSFPTYKLLCRISRSIGIGDAFCIESFDFTIINIEVAGQFLAHLRIAIVLGFIAAFPYVFWEIWRFVSPALKDRERKGTRGVVFWASLLFAIGVLFGYYLLAPFSISFFANYGVSDLVDNQWQLTNYVSVLTMIVMASGILFELPMVVYIFSRLGLVTPQLMRSYRRYAILSILLISAVITPADAGTQVLVAIPIFFLYEISIFISARQYKKRQKELV